MVEHQSPFLVRQRRRLTAVGIGQLRGLLDVLNQVDPGRSEALVGLGLRPAFHQGLDDTSSSDLFASTVENLFLQLSDESISLVAQLDGELRHNAGRQLSHL